MSKPRISPYVAKWQDKLPKLKTACEQLIRYIGPIQRDIAQEAVRPLQETSSDRKRELTELHADLGTLSISAAQVATRLTNEGV
jgi:hypothetical protein